LSNRGGFTVGLSDRITEGHLNKKKVFNLVLLWIVLCLIENGILHSALLNNVLVWSAMKDFPLCNYRWDRHYFIVLFIFASHDSLHCLCDFM